MPTVTDTMIRYQGAVVAGYVCVGCGQWQMCGEEITEVTFDKAVGD